MRTAILIARKDLRQRLRDRSAIIYGVIAPLGLAFLFSLIMNPIQNSTFEATYVVVDHDHGQISQAFTQILEGLAKEGSFEIRSVGSLAEAREQVSAGSDPFADDEDPKADAAFLLPAGLSQGVMSGQGGRLEVIGARGSDLAAPIALSVAQGFAAEMAAVEIAVRTAMPASAVHDPTATAALTQAATRTKNPVVLKDVSAQTKQLDQTTYLAAGMAVFFLFFTVSFGVSGLLEEKRIGTMSRLLAAPISPTSIVIGKALTSFVLGILSMTILVIGSTVLFGAEWGNPIGVGMLIVAATISAMGILFVVAAAAKTQDQAGSFQAIIALVLAFLGGTFFQISQVGGFIEKLSLLTPHAWFLRGLGDLQGGDVASVLPSVLALLAFGLVAGAIAWPFLRRAVQR
jgi:ABC-2 type transport system permease protein